MPALTLPVMGAASIPTNNGQKGQNTVPLELTARFAALLDNRLVSQTTGANFTGQVAGKNSGTPQTSNSPAGKTALDIKDFLAGCLAQLTLSSGSNVKVKGEPASTHGAKQTVEPDSGTNANAELVAMAIAQLLLGGLQQDRLSDPAGNSQETLAKPAAANAVPVGNTAGVSGSFGALSSAGFLGKPDDSGTVAGVSAGQILAALAAASTPGEGNLAGGSNMEQVLSALAAIGSPGAGNEDRGSNLPGVSSAVGNTSLAEDYANLLKTLPNSPLQDGGNGLNPQTQTALTQSVNALLQELSGNVQETAKAPLQIKPQIAEQTAPQIAAKTTGQNTVQTAAQTAAQTTAQTAVQNPTGPLNQVSASQSGAAGAQWGGSSIHSMNAGSVATPTAKAQPVQGEGVNILGQATFGDSKGTGNDTTQSGHSDGQQSHSDRSFADMFIPGDKGQPLQTTPGANVIDTVQSAPGGLVEVWQQISAGLAQNLRKGSSSIKELTLQLQPDKLGKIQIALSWDNKQVSLHIVAANDSTAKMLQGHMNDLRNSLESAGVSCGSLDLGFSGGFNRSWQQNASQTLPQNSSPNSQPGVVQAEEQGTGPQTLPYDTRADEPYRINVTA